FLWIIEPAGGLGLLVGFLTRLAALGLVIVMLGAIQFLITKVHRKFTGENAAGWEFEFMLLIVALALAILGGGKYALDRVILGIAARPSGRVQHPGLRISARKYNHPQP